ncbi:helix-turn-helix domain-containing protein [Lentilactobacillus otakiensis]|uniref:helix-turn-helix domain-containing protein n=1 Tax=Lentilactobacillus otakiensis TaxID=481720 RepID=UPI003D174A42
MATWNEFKQNLDPRAKDSMTIIETLATLHAERIKRDITQKDFAKRIGMKQPQLAKIERLDSLPSLSTLNRYAKGLGLEIKISLEPVK